MEERKGRERRGREKKWKGREGAGAWCHPRDLLAQRPTFYCFSQNAENEILLPCGTENAKDCE